MLTPARACEFTLQPFISVKVVQPSFILWPAYSFAAVAGGCHSHHHKNFDLMLIPFGLTSANINIDQYICIYICIYIYISAYTHSHTSIHTYIHTYVHSDRQTDRRTDGQTDRQTDRQIDIFNRSVYIHMCILNNFCTWCLYLHTHTYIYIYGTPPGTHTFHCSAQVRDSVRLPKIPKFLKFPGPCRMYMSIKFPKFPKISKISKDSKIARSMSHVHESKISKISKISNLSKISTISKISPPNV